MRLLFAALLSLSAAVQAVTQSQYVAVNDYLEKLFTGNVVITIITSKDIKPPTSKKISYELERVPADEAASYKHIFQAIENAESNFSKVLLILDSNVFNNETADFINESAYLLNMVVISLPSADFNISVQAGLIEQHKENCWKTKINKRVFDSLSIQVNPSPPEQFGDGC